jgi:phosphate transport system protein
MVRVNFAEELEIAESGLMAEGRLVLQQLERVLEALERRDHELAASVIKDDDRVDDIYLATETRVLNLLALQSPVAGDLRLVNAILHSNVHIERVGDLCVNIAKFVQNSPPFPSNSPQLTRLQEMGMRAGELLDTALRAFSERDAELAEELPVKDNVLDRLNRGMLEDLKEYAGDERSFEWAVNFILVARYMERMGDHAVDIGERTSYLVTGVMREFTDAAHPEGVSSP